MAARRTGSDAEDVGDVVGWRGWKSDREYVGVLLELQLIGCAKQIYAPSEALGCLGK